MSPPASGKSDNFVVNFLLGGVSGGIRIVKNNLLTKFINKSIIISFPTSKTCVAPIERVKLLLQNQVASHHMAQMGHKPYTGNIIPYI